MGALPTTMPAMGAMPAMRAMPMTMPATMPTVPLMKGGGRSESNGLRPVLAGSLAALLLAGGAKGFYDFIRRQM
jgi:hypothetical protein